jgi:hypothetical protein
MACTMRTDYRVCRLLSKGNPADHPAGSFRNDTEMGEASDSGVAQDLRPKVLPLSPVTRIRVGG